MNNDTIAERYESAENPRQRQTRWRVHWLCAQAVGQDVLDIGCSQGIASLLLGREGFDVVGIDREPPALDEARRRLELEAELVRRHVTFVEAEARALDYPDASFDTILLGEVLEHQVQYRPILAEAVRLLRPDGVIVITVPYGLDTFDDHKEPVYVETMIGAVEDVGLGIGRLELIDRWLGIVARREGERPLSAWTELAWGALRAAERRLAERDDAVEEQRKRIRKLRQDHNAVQAQLEKARNQATAKDRQAASDQPSAADAERRAEIERLTAELETVRTEGVRAEAQRAELDAALGEARADLEAARTELAGTQARLAEADEGLGASGERIAALESRLAAEAVELVAARKAMEEAVAEATRTTAALAEARSETDRATATAATADEDRDAARRESEALRRESEARRQESETLRQESETLRHESRRCATIETLRQESETLRQESETLRQDSQTLRQESDVLRRELAETTARERGLAIEIRQADERRRELEEVVAVLQERSESLSARLREAEIADRTPAAAPVPAAPPPAPAPAPAPVPVPVPVPVPAPPLVAAEPPPAASHEAPERLLELQRRNAELDEQLAAHRRALRSAEKRVTDLVNAAREDVRRLQQTVDSDAPPSSRLLGPWSPLDPDAAERYERMGAGFLVGRVGAAWLADVPGLATRALDGASLERDAEQVIDGLSAVVLGPEAENAPAAVAALKPAAALRQLPVIDLGGGAGAGAARPFDPRSFGPAGFIRETPAVYAVAPSAGHAVEGAIAAALEARAGTGRLLLFGAAGALGDGLRGDAAHVPGDGVAPGGVHPDLRACRAALDHPGLYPSDAVRAEQIARIAATGVPVLLDDPPEPVREALGGELIAALGRFTPEVLADPSRREAASVRMRRAALRHHSLAGRWRQLATRLPGHIVGPALTLLLSVEDPARLDAAVEIAAAQTVAGAELIVVLRGDGFPHDAAAGVRERFGGEVTVLRAPADATRPAAYDLGTEAAAGDIVVVLDEHAVYGAEHAEDLMLALEHSGADVAGKAAEFLHVADRDVTIRRWSAGAERPGTRLSPTAVAVRRAVLTDVGGWRRPDGSGRRIVDAIKTAGCASYRTHGLGFIARAAADVKANGAGRKSLLDEAEATWPGLALEAAGIVPAGDPD